MHGHANTDGPRSLLGWPARGGPGAEPDGPAPDVAPAADDAPGPSGSPDDGEELRSVWLRPAPTERPAALTREAIVAAAVRLADAEGIEAVSIRRVAAALGARPMSLYSHIGRKQDLIELMVNEAVAECVVPGDLPADWREALSAIAYHTRDGLLRHPWVITVVPTSSMISPNALRSFEQSLAAMAGLDLDPERTIAILSAVDTYTIGQVVRELAGLPTAGPRDGAQPPDDREPPAAPPGRASVRDGRGARSTGSWMRAAESYMRKLVETGDYPHIDAFGIDAVISAHETETDASDRRFAVGLAWLLDGIAASLDAGRSARAE
jgi:AcrR family transcriptional regulator